MFVRARGLEGCFSCIIADVNRSACLHYTASIVRYAHRRHHPSEENRRCKWAVSPSFSHTHTHLPPLPPQNRKHTYLCRGHLPARACPLCGCLYKPGILLPCSPGSERRFCTNHWWTGCLNRMTHTRRVDDKKRCYTYYCLCWCRLLVPQQHFRVSVCSIGFHCWVMLSVYSLCLIVITTLLAVIF